MARIAFQLLGIIPLIFSLVVVQSVLGMGFPLEQSGGSQSSATVTVSGTIVIQPLPGYLPPSDPDHDGMYEDLNGNGRKDFNDVVLYFGNLEWIARHGPVNIYDYNGNSRIDFNDIIRLFEEL
jgi:PKD repeat protein